LALEKYRGDSFRRSAGSRSARNYPDRSCKNLVHALAIHIYDFKAPAAEIYVIGDRRDTPESHHQKSAQCLKPAVLLTRQASSDTKFHTLRAQECQLIILSRCTLSLGAREMTPGHQQSADSGRGSGEPGQDQQTAK
jgi:hypothetical protein